MYFEDEDDTVELIGDGGEPPVRLEHSRPRPRRGRETETDAERHRRRMDAAAGSAPPPGGGGGDDEGMSESLHEVIVVPGGVDGESTRSDDAEATWRGVYSKSSKVSFSVGVDGDDVGVDEGGGHDEECPSLDAATDDIREHHRPPQSPRPRSSTSSLRSGGHSSSSLFARPHRYRHLRDRYHPHSARHISEGSNLYPLPLFVDDEEEASSSSMRRILSDPSFDPASEDTPADERKRFFEGLIRAEFPPCHTVDDGGGGSSSPNAYDVVRACTHSSGARRRYGAEYCPGDWVEVRGKDMKWRLEMVTRVVKRAPEDWDWNDPGNEGQTPNWKFLYHAGEFRMLDLREVRSSEEGLRRIFGRRPWVWQQWACLKLENDLRFQKGHQDDFASKDVRRFVADLWDSWVRHPSNDDFRRHLEDRRVGDVGRRELIHHIMRPFELIDDMKEAEGGDDSSGVRVWTFAEDPYLSVYTYLAILGSGFLVPFVICGIQLLVPFLLVAPRSSLEGNETAETAPRSMVTTLMVFLVMIYYLFKVVPVIVVALVASLDTSVAFYNTVGSAGSVYSRLLSLRQELWNQGDGSFGQMIGYKMELYMNTAYTSFLYMLNMYILLQENNAFEVLLNALAVEFIVRLDEEYVKSYWWDPGRRWLMAGAIEVVLRKTLRLEWLRSAKLFALHFDFCENLLLDACDGDEHLLCNEAVAQQDSTNMAFMNRAEAINYQCYEAAIDMKNITAIREYHKPDVHFGVLDNFIFKTFHVKGLGMFSKYGSFRTWSRWKNLLYHSPIPSLDDLFITDKNGSVNVKDELKVVVPTMAEPFANFDPEERSISPRKALIKHCINVLSFRHMIQRIFFAWKDEKYYSLLFRLLDGLLQWIAYVIQIIFPLVAVTAPFLAFWWDDTVVKFSHIRT